MAAAVAQARSERSGQGRAGRAHAVRPGGCCQGAKVGRVFGDLRPSCVGLMMSALCMSESSRQPLIPSTRPPAER